MVWFARRIVVPAMVVMVRVMAWVPAMDPWMVTAMAWVPVMVRVRLPGLQFHDRGERHARHHHHHPNRLLRRLRTSGGQRFPHQSMCPNRSNRVPGQLPEGDDLDKTWIS
jgi:hypothetical protein